MTLNCLSNRSIELSLVSPDFPILIYRFTIYVTGTPTQPV